MAQVGVAGAGFAQTFRAVSHSDGVTMNHDDRLSQIETAWSIVRRAHGDESLDARSAKEQLIERYGSAIRRYLLGALRDEISADDVYQEFAVSFINGDFHRASQEKGRFRSFLKTALFRLVADHYRAKKRRNAIPLEHDPDAASFVADARVHEEAFAEVWRDEMLKRSWNSLAEAEKRSGKPWFTVMRLRVEQPELRSAQLAELVSAELERPITSANVRVLLHRARERFSALLIDSIAESLNTTCVEEIEEELAELRLLEYCHAALEQRKTNESQ